MGNPAETYETYMVPALFAPWASMLVDVADPRAGERVLDVACGTGIVARTVARRVGPTGSVAGLDASPSMLEVARTAALGAPLDIEFIEGRAESLDFGDGAFDLVTCGFGLMFFSDRVAALREMRRVLQPEGRIAVSVWNSIDRHPFYAALDTVIRNHLGISSVQDVFVLGDAGVLRSLLRDAGFDEVDVVEESMTARFPDSAAFLDAYINVYTASALSLGRLEQESLQSTAEAIRSDMARSLREWTEGDEVILPYHAIIAIGRA